MNCSGIISSRDRMAKLLARDVGRRQSWKDRRRDSWKDRRRDGSCWQRRSCNEAVKELMNGCSGQLRLLRLKIVGKAAGPGGLILVPSKAYSPFVPNVAWLLNGSIEIPRCLSFLSRFFLQYRFTSLCTTYTKRQMTKITAHIDSTVFTAHAR
jgi:hypothetical protein